MNLPPHDIPPGRLFRLLAERRPSLPLAFRIRGASDVRLRAGAVPSRVLLACWDELTGVPEDMRDAQLTADLIAASLTVDGSPAFVDGAAVARVLDEREVRRLGAHVFNALARCSPTYATSDTVAWLAALQRGAEQNPSDAASMHACVDQGGIPRPDRYWGIPARDLLDGHWLCWRAARAVFEKKR